MTYQHIQQCPAKVNLALAVGKPRAGDGYHPICSWMTPVSFYDELLIAPSDGQTRFAVRWADDAPQTSPIDWPIEKDLAFRAHGLMEEAAGEELPVSVLISKRIPVGAGLGGGSSDAAGMLLALNELFSLGRSVEQLAALATKLGSDVSFFLHGPRGVMVSGVGEVCQAAPLAKAADLVLILPPLHCNTAAVYRAFDELKPDAHADEADVRALSGATLLMDDELFNDLAEAAFTVEPRLREVHQACQVAAQRRVHVTGSGAAMFAICRNEQEAKDVAAEVTRQANVPAVAVRTLS